MSSTEQVLDLQSNRVLTSPRVQTQAVLRDATAIRAINLDWAEPAGASRTVTIPDPTVDTEVVLKDTQQTLINKKYTGPIVAVDDMVNKNYVDTAVSGAVPTGTSAPGGGTQGKVSADSNKGLVIVAGVLAVAPNTLRGLQNQPTGLEVKIDNSSVTFNGSGQLQATSGASTTGNVTSRIPFTRDIPAVTAVPQVLVGTNIDALDYQKGLATSGQRFEFTVPDDYYSGDLSLYAVYRMSTAVASPNNQIRISTQAEIVDVSLGTIDLATYPETQANLLTPNNTTLIVRQQILLLTSGTFDRGDTIEFFIKRFDGSGFDLHTGSWQVISFEPVYGSIINMRLATQPISKMRNAVAETATTVGTIGTNIDTVDYPTGADAGAKIAFVVPDSWDGVSDCLVSVVYAMSTGVVGVVQINNYGEIADVNTGTVVAISSQNYDLMPAATTNPTRSTAIRVIPAALLHKGDDVTLVLARRVAVGGNHTGTFKLLAVLVTFSIAPITGYSTVLVTESYLEQPTFGNQVGTVTSDVGYPSFAGDFDAFITMSSISVAGRLDCAFPGRLGTGQTTIASTRLSVLGTGGSPQYRLKIYAEGSGAVPVYDSGLTAAPGVATELAVLAVSLSAQPTTQKRYFVVVEAYVDVGEAVYCSMPFVRQE